MAQLKDNPKTFDPTADNVTVESLDDDVIEIKDQLKFLQQRRIMQQDVIPGAIKQRHIGEAPKFINGGLSTNRPTKPDVSAIGIYVYFEVDTFKLYIYTGSVWKSVTLS